MPHLRALRESETGQGAFDQVAVLHANELPLLIIIRYLQPRHTLPVFPRGQPAPAHHARIQPPLVEEEPPCLVVQPRPLEEPLIARGVERGLMGEG